MDLITSSTSPTDTREVNSVMILKVAPSFGQINCFDRTLLKDWARNRRRLQRVKIQRIWMRQVGTNILLDLFTYIRYTYMFTFKKLHQVHRRILPTENDLACS